MFRLVWYEWKKAFIKKSVFIFTIVLIIVNFIKIFSVYHESSYLAGQISYTWNKEYWSMYPNYNGIISLQSIEKLLEIYRPLEEKVMEMTASTKVDEENYLTGNAYSDYNFLDRYYVSPIKNFYNYKENAKGISQEALYNASYYNKIDNLYEERKNAYIYHLFNNRIVKDFSYLEVQELYINYNFSDILILLIILYGIVSVYANEIDGKMNLLLLTNVNGRRKTTLAKIIAVDSFILSVTFLFSLADFIDFALVSQSVEGLKMPVYAISYFKETPLRIYVFQYILLSAVVKGAGFIIIGNLVILLAMIFKNTLFTFLTGGVISMALAFIYEKYCYSFYLWRKILNPYSLIGNLHLFEKTEFISFFNYPILGWQAAIGLAMIYIMLLTVLLLVLTKDNCHCRRKICLK